MRGMIRSVLVAVLLGGVTVTAAQLPPEIMADRYLVQVERLMGEKDYEGALGAMGRIIALQKEHDLELPDKFHFKHAQVAWLAGSIKAAMNSVNKYLAVAGREGEFYREALELLDKAEQLPQDDVEAQYRLGIMYANGLGVPKDYVKAYAWVSLAADQGNKQAIKFRDQLRQGMSRKQLVAARKLADELSDRIESTRSE